MEERRGSGEPARPGEILKDGTGFLYTVMLNGGPLGGKWEYTATELIGSDDNLQITLLDGVTGNRIDAIDIDATGNVTEHGG